VSIFFMEDVLGIGDRISSHKRRDKYNTILIEMAIVCASPADSEMCYHGGMSDSLPGRHPFSRLGLALTALRELGPGQLGAYALYRIGLRSGITGV